MNPHTQTAIDDLAFMRSLVDARAAAERPFGEAYLAAGLIYGVQMLLHFAQGMDWLPFSALGGLMVGVAPTFVFLAVLIWILRRHRHAKPTGVAARAINAVFIAVGLANLALVAVIGSVAWRHHSVTIWLIYPCSVFVLQGAAWLVAFALRRRRWLALVGLGWFAVAVAMAVSIEAPLWFMLWAGVGFLVLMVTPGAAIIRLSQTA